MNENHEVSSKTDIPRNQLWVFISKISYTDKVIVEVSKSWF